MQRRAHKESNGHNLIRCCCQKCDQVTTWYMHVTNGNKYKSQSSFTSINSTVSVLYVWFVVFCEGSQFEYLQTKSKNIDRKPEKGYRN